jgi:hypothetical protein
LAQKVEDVRDYAVVSIVNVAPDKTGNYLAQDVGQKKDCSKRYTGTAFVGNEERCTKLGRVAEAAAVGCPSARAG